LSVVIVSPDMLFISCFKMIVVSVMVGNTKQYRVMQSW